MRRLVLVTAVVLVAACSSGSSEPDPEPGEGSTTTTRIEAGGSISIVSLNVLHGIPGVTGCADDSDFCHAPTRLSLLFDAIENEADCPDVVALEEIGSRQQELVPERLGQLCDGTYDLLFSDKNSPDQEMILAGPPVADQAFVDLSGPPWTAQWGRLDTDVGLVDILATHYASSSFNPDCTSGSRPSSCSPPCPTGIEMGTCNAIETVDFLDERSDGAVLQVVAGDLNRSLDDPRIGRLTDAGFADTWNLAGLGACDPATGTGCTCCVEGAGDLAGLGVADQNFDERIDFIFARSPGSTCEVGADRNGTGVFPVGPLDPPVSGLAWFSDHQGTQAVMELRCGSS